MKHPVHGGNREISLFSSTSCDCAHSRYVRYRHTWIDCLVTGYIECTCSINRQLLTSCISRTTHTCYSRTVYCYAGHILLLRIGFHHHHTHINCCTYAVTVTLLYAQDLPMRAKYCKCLHSLSVIAGFSALWVHFLMMVKYFPLLNFFGLLVLKNPKVVNCLPP